LPKTDYIAEDIDESTFTTMKRITSCLFGILLSVPAFAQQPEFEGRLVYKTTVQSRNSNLPVSLLQRLLFATDSVTVLVKDGNYRQFTSLSDEYFIRKDEKVYVRFKGIDTLYYRDYADDTATVQFARKVNESRSIAGYDCSAFTIATANDTIRYLYSTRLYANPENTKKLLLGQMNIFGEQTASLWLERERKTANYILTYSCFRVQGEKLDDKQFALPALPVAKLSNSSVFKAPAFSGRGTWGNYLQNNMDTKVVTTFLKIKKKEKSAEQMVKVSFIVLKNGEIANVQVINEEKIHPALMDEAIRLVKASKWRPAELIGEKLDFPLVQPITFRVEAE
jgi:hypothetical protein